ncbi:dihydrolipoamide acetyltransferase component of pyruvate dehydrogenase complex [hydrocarbon metagenome]|uniref:Dihydrolipoyllysine-residue acetyltransferase component of pyruvate dehydrogenase complex n=1 Tax=hydrocarbon metagenome TaxID=938273 RepID=A0A0W8G191_9ZZZZ
MAIEFKLPELGENIETAQIVKVIVSEGDVIKEDDIILEIETDKATVEVPSDVGGKVSKMHVKDGDTAKVGQIILTLEAGDAKEEKPEPKEEKKHEVKKEEAKKEDKKEEPKKEETKKESSKQKQKAEGGIYEFKLPELGENIESADVTAVLVKVGDQINEDDPVLEIETDKATVEVPIDKSGKVKEVKIKEGQKAKIGETVIVIELTDSVSEEEESLTEPEEKAVEEKKEEKTETKEETDTKPLSIPQISDSTHSARQFKKELPDKIAPASPSVRRFSREIGINIHQVRGTGPGGRISVEDVKVFAKNLNEKISKGKGTIGVSAEPLPDFSKWGKIQREEMSNIRKITAEHLSYAWSVIPHVTQFDKADITELEKLRKQYSKEVDAAGGKLTVTAILVKIIAEALKKFPQFNCSIDMDKKEIIYKKYYNVGIAVDTDRGLLVPVIKDADKKNVTEISVELGELAAKARDKKLSLDEMQGGNFSISNLGGIGGTYFTPIVNSPEVAILGVSRGNYEPVYKDGEFVPRLMLPLSLSYDHRIIDGADAIRFLRWVVESLENPFRMLL